MNVGARPVLAGMNEGAWQQGVAGRQTDELRV